MKQLAFWAMAAVLVLTACGDGKSFAVKGKVADSSLNGALLILQQVNFETGESKLLDSAFVKDNEFEFHGLGGELPEFCVVSPKKPDGKFPSVTFVREPGKIKIDIKDIDNFEVSGTPSNDQYQKMQTEVFALQKKAQQATSQQERDKLIQQVLSAVYEYAKQNIQNPTGEQIFGSIAYALTPEQVAELVKMGRPSFQKKESVQMLLKAIDARSKVGQNKPYQDVQLPDANGKSVALSNYVGKGKYVLVDFWASWCGPCIQEMPNVVAAYAKYKDKGFEIVGISLDEDKASWLKAIDAHKMTWPQLSDLKGWESVAAQLYGVQSIPFTMLIGKDGKIVATNLRGDELDHKLGELLN
jgi:peroxiredoxin